MSDWTSGYVADIGYTFGYYNELNPIRAKLAFLNAGVLLPEVGTACELGYGQGLSINLHAAASTVGWYGTDFNPSQAAFAQELARASEAEVHLFDEGFAEFCQRPDLPAFDYIGLHGIWSWISDANRKILIKFVAQKLKVGGVLYVSYNTQPGWATTVPLRHLLTEHAEVMAASGRGMSARIDSAIDFAEKLLATNPLYARANPQVAERIKSIKGQSRNYLAHEYFNRDWYPMLFGEMAETLSLAKLDYVGSATYIDHVPHVNLTPEQQTLLNEIPDRMFAESVRDFMVNQQFRKDYWIKGVRKLSALERAEAIRQHKVVLVIPRSEVTLSSKGALGEVNMNANVYEPILDVLADHVPKTLGEIERAVQSQGIRLAQVLEVAVVLTDKNAIFGLQEESGIVDAKKATTRLNAYLMKKARGSGDIGYLASPVTGGGIIVGRFSQIFLLALSEGKTTPQEIASYVWDILRAQGQGIAKDGRALETAEENLNELNQQATKFIEKQLPILKALQIA